MVDLTFKCKAVSCQNPCSLNYKVILPLISTVIFLIFGSIDYPIPNPTLDMKYFHIIPNGVSE